MESISTFVGNKIKFYRKRNGYSLDQLAQIIHKSKSTLSKYENGNIALDVETLLEIAKALHVEVSQLVDYHYQKEETPSPLRNPFGQDQLSLYYYDGRKKEIVQSLITLSENPGQNKITANFYLDIPSYQDYDKCHFFYTGEMNAFDLVTYITLINQNNPMERMEMCILNSFNFQQNQATWGFMSGISYQPIAPFTLKFLLTPRPLADSELSLQDLLITRDEIKTLKYYNMMLLNHQPI
ncbi:MAG: helix-turn-helix domain-containing protein [Lachnospiraceae bacterium]|nr:helix-turn-helix domain-containing protein [Lachnospiraceae bacterium]